MRLQFFCIFFSLCTIVLGQIDSLDFQSGVTIDEITIATDAYPSHIAVIHQQLSKTSSLKSSFANLGDLVSREHNIYIKSYGIGSSSTLSLRGGSSNQTLIQWEGVAINNPMLGLSDISLLPLQAFTNLSIAKGGASAHAGSGAITGVLNLSNDVRFSENSSSIYIEGGSFDAYGLGLNVSQNKGAFSYSLKAQINKAENNFEYLLPTSGVSKEVSNAAYNNKSVVLSTAYQINKSNRLKLDGWLQETFREIPPLTTQNRSDAFQEDRMKRFILSWEKPRSTTDFKMKLGYFDESNDFFDPLIALESFNKFQRIIQQTQYNFSWNDWQLRLKYDFTHTLGRSDFYLNNKQTLNQFNVFSSLSTDLKKFKVNLDLHKQWNNFNTPDLIPALSVSSLNKHFNYRFKISKEYRVPTLNELFWTPGGSSELNPESGWSEELRLQYEKKNWSNHLSIYHREITDWILWHPEDGQFFWSAANLSKVQSYGLENNFKVNFKTKSVEHYLAANYSYTISKNKVSISTPKIEEGAQLIYTPIHAYTVQLKSNYKSLFSVLSTRYQSTSLGINEDVEGFQLLDLNIGFDFTTSKVNQQISFDINNLLNTNYRIIERRPMPGQNFMIRWSITI